MRQRTLIPTLVWLWLCLLVALPANAQKELLAKLQQLSSLTQVDTLPASKYYPHRYLLRFKQPIDHSHPERGSFSQRILLCHKGFDRPTVIETEGYDANYSLYPNYREELSLLIDANLLVVEHRYFDESTPAPCDWQYLTTENSAHDLHAVTTTFKTIYPGKWAASGISKGGQTTLLYRTYYPDDVDFSVPYVAPLCFSDQDRRPEKFLQRVGTDEQRSRILAFQREVLSRRATIQPLFEQYCQKAKLEFRAPLPTILDFCVLEYPFALWQWGTSTDQIPATSATDEELLKHLMQISNADYFRTGSPHLSFFVQAARELGYYTYDIRPFKGLLSIESSRDYLHRLMLPAELKEVKFDKRLSQRIRKFLQKEDPRILFVYGETDPWTSAGVTYLKGKQNIHVFIGAGGSHATRIQSLSSEQQSEVKRILTEWLAEE